MSAAISPVLYTEARLNIEPTSPASILQISTDSSSSIFASRKRTRGVDNGAAQDEDEYARRHLSVDSSIFFRPLHRTPRSILWRVLDDSKSLELQSVDLTQNRRDSHESLLTFSLSFANPIRPNGVAFADSTSHDALEVFVLLTSNELFTFSLRPDLLLRRTVPTASDSDPSIFKTFALSSFSFRHPYKLIALSDLQLVVSLHDGALLRLDRRVGENGALWRETFFHEGGWGSSLRGLIPWKGQNTVRFGNIELAPTTATAIRSSPSGSHVFTVSLDHTLKAWNADTGKIGFQVDLLGEPRPEGRPANQYLINPNQSSLMKIFDVKKKPAGHSFYCVVYSPKNHQFKFWAVDNPDDGEAGLTEVQPDVKFIPPLDELMDTNVWQMADFDLEPGEDMWENTRLWVRARSGAHCQIFTVKFDLLTQNTDDIVYAWKHEWATVDAGSLSISHLSNSPSLKLSSDNDQGDQVTESSDEWLDFLTYPGRFSPSSLETALNIYRHSHGLGNSSKSVTSNTSYQERLRHSITAKIGLTRTAEGHVDTDRYIKNINSQWKAFYGLVKHLHQRRADSLSLALDRATGLSWSIRADQVAPIRKCSGIEVDLLNEKILAEQEDDWILNSFPLTDSIPNDLALSAARLLCAANIFRAGLSAPFNRNFGRLSSAFALRDAETDFSHRSRKPQSSPLQQLYDHCDFAHEVGDDEFNTLTDSVQDLGGLGQIENTVFEAVLTKLTEVPRGQKKDVTLFRYGDKATIAVAQDTLLDGRQWLLDLLALVTFMSQDLETDELARGFKPMELYSIIVNKLREFDVLLWMASNTRLEKTKTRRTSASDGLHSEHDDTEQLSMTILGSVFIGDWPDMVFPEEKMTDLITHWSRAWTFGSSLNIQYDGVTAHIMSNLLKHENYRLAFDFARFLPKNSWTTYLKGRLYLGEGEYSAAAASFRRAAQDLSQPTKTRMQPMETVDTANLLSGLQRQYFNAGTPRFYLHCSSLFEHGKLPSFAADFAAFALRELEEQTEETLDSSMMDIDNRKRSMLDSPAAARVDLAMEEIRLLKVSELKEDILSRLFNASLQTSRYQAAFEALTKITNPAIKRASLTQLLTSILAASPSLLLTLPFPSDLVSDVDKALLKLARKHFSTSTSSPSITTAPSYHTILYSWRISQENYRGAAEGLYERLQHLKSDTSDDSPSQEAEDILDTYLLLINTLACCGPDEGWILAEPPPPEGKDFSASMLAVGKRKIVTLDDVRAEYQAELDRRSEIAHGRFALTGAVGEGMEVDVF
ncbi:hypothetical protein K461DRAFT_322084 [Myriangium duriaei CBS 260.36]|uniref:Nucleoporin Nup120/160 n=1 Tax=Myriangium duriaei CBS 260.36 TaxID=1168546 RepID=A0A9P4J405_9PEZI|nr:hypothetical protein K461DRAFT_322084 [Myriangium duriaei CBS 260.36]